MDMSKYREMYLAEAKEHLQNMGDLLLTLEKDPGDREGIDALFREAHSIKGMAASMGFEKSAAVAHSMEDLMDGFRKSGVVPAEAIDRLLEGSDLLEGLLEDVQADREERSVEAYLSAEAPVEAAAPAPPPRASATRAAASPESTRGAGLDVRVELAADALAPAARSLLILRELEGLGRVVACRPSAEQLSAGKSSRTLVARLAAGVEGVRVEKALASMPDVARVAVATLAPKAPPAPQRRKEDLSPSVRVRTALLDRFVNLTGELITSRYTLQAAAAHESWPEVREGVAQLARLVSNLHHHVLRVRMMPLESITGRLPRLVRDLGRKTGKKVRLRIEGEAVELDRAILEALADPLVHMVRNAVDHGIERSGDVLVRARREKDMALLEVVDNGRGMDPAVIRAKALEKGLVSAAQADALSDRASLRLVCLPGFSTAVEVSQTSGRGVGMDVVKSAVESLGGSFDIASQPGRGTRLRLRFPLSVAIVQVLLVECAGHLLGIPTTKVISTLEAAPGQVKRSGRGMAVSLDEALVPLLSLRKILGLPARPSRGNLPLVLTEIRGRRVALTVDRLAGVREVFVKNLAPPLDRHGGVSGTTILGDGSVVFIIDPRSLLETRPRKVAA
ncbi:MAG: hypothetical protein C0617_11385 [Desulfuromonas sp.]|uniref:chemotaxis protein CheA n=1 Tax=Desulfuromonas sp. TaxID=892 RepID=UPI000CC369D2|nr:chemotaxis protein CheA [Desulfuromonas sp.]PLX83521.1 MAG: hypothetical protein C0617_11385 [Desulfuromonas sp.]